MAAASIPATKANPTTPIHNPPRTAYHATAHWREIFPMEWRVFSAALHKYDTRMPLYERASQQRRSEPSCRTAALSR